MMKGKLEGADFSKIRVLLSKTKAAQWCHKQKAMWDELSACLSRRLLLHTSLVGAKTRFSKGVERAAFAEISGN